MSHSRCTRPLSLMSATFFLVLALTEQASAQLIADTDSNMLRGGPAQYQVLDKVEGHYLNLNFTTVRPMVLTEDNLEDMPKLCELASRLPRGARSNVPPPGT